VIGKVIGKVNWMLQDKSFPLYTTSNKLLVYVLCIRLILFFNHEKSMRLVGFQIPVSKFSTVLKKGNAYMFVYAPYGDCMQIVLMEIAAELDRREYEIMPEMTHVHISFPLCSLSSFLLFYTALTFFIRQQRFIVHSLVYCVWFCGQKPSQNVGLSGQFSLQVIIEALKTFHLNVAPLSENHHHNHNPCPSNS
jgi:hypothetical protein